MVRCEVTAIRVPALDQHRLVSRELRIVAPAVAGRVAREVILADAVGVTDLEDLARLGLGLGLGFG